MKQVVSYFRVSTARQGASGLGLEAQRAAVAEFCQANGFEVVAEFREIESGRKNSRPVLQKALARARRLRVTLLIAKLDRLARNVAFIANLMESGVEFRACDMPEASRFVLHIMAAVAEQEARAISDRTKAALGAAKARGTRLGASNPACRNLTSEARLRGAERTAKLAADAYGDVVPQVRDLRASGLSYQRIADYLNEQGRCTRAGREWRAMQVRRVLTLA